MRTIETKVYLINEHPDKEKCFEWIRNNWHDLNQHSVEEVVDSLKELNKRIGGNLDWSISQVPDRGEYITLTDYNDEELLLLNAEDCPLTGVCYDVDVIMGLKEGNLNKVLDVIHAETEYVYSDEALLELCDSMGYEFTEEGNVI